MKKNLIVMLFFMAPIAIFAQSLAPKLGHFNSQEIIALLPEAKKIQDLRNDQAEGLAKLEALFNESVEKYQLEMVGLSDAERQSREKDLYEMQDRLQKRAQYYDQEYQEVYQREWPNVVARVSKAIKELGEEGGYLYIFDVASGALSYISETLSTDVTGAVKAKLGIK